MNPPNQIPSLHSYYADLDFLDECEDFSNYNPENNYIVSVDIGVKHLALVLIEFDKKWNYIDIIWFELIDITRHYHASFSNHNEYYIHDDAAECTLKHTKTFTDWLNHVFWAHEELFKLATVILVERQPPTGFVVVEQLFYFNWRDKCVLVHPISVHSHFKWDGDYDARKQKSHDELCKYLARSPRKYLLENLALIERSHDVSDAFCQALYWSSLQRSTILENKSIEELNERLSQINLDFLEHNNVNIHEFLESFTRN